MLPKMIFTTVGFIVCRKIVFVNRLLYYQASNSNFVFLSIHYFFNGSLLLSSLELPYQVMYEFNIKEALLVVSFLTSRKVLKRVS